MTFFNLDSEKMKDLPGDPDFCKRDGILFENDDKNIERIQIENYFNLLEEVDKEILNDPDHFTPVLKPSRITSLHEKLSQISKTCSLKQQSLKDS